MTYSIVFSSRTGNTEQLARAIRSVLPAGDCLYFGGPDAAALAADRLYICLLYTSLEDKQLREQLYAAVMALPDKQAKRIYAHFYLGMTPKEIAQAEGVDPGRVRDSIRKGLRKLAKQSW